MGRISPGVLHRRSHFEEIVAAVFILLFVYTGISKLLTVDRFAAVLSRSPLVGSVSSWIAYLIPVAELVVGSLLLIPRTRRVGLLLSLVLMVGFTGYISYMMIFAHHLPCSCGGIIQQLSWTEHLWLNIMLTALAAVAVFHEKLYKLSLDRRFRKSHHLFN